MGWSATKNWENPTGIGDLRTSGLENITTSSMGWSWLNPKFLWFIHPVLSDVFVVKSLRNYEDQPTQFSWNRVALGCVRDRNHHRILDVVRFFFFASQKSRLKHTISNKQFLRCEIHIQKKMVTVSNLIQVIIQFHDISPQISPNHIRYTREKNRLEIRSDPNLSSR